MEKPDHVFEVSWEVCQMVGGIHTVIQSKALEMEKLYGKNYICFGPQIISPALRSEFKEEIWDESIERLMKRLGAQGVQGKMGRWQIPGEPRVILVGFQELFNEKDQILSHYWTRFGVDSLFGGYDYIEPLLFSHATGLLIEQLYKGDLAQQGKQVLVHCHEWMSAIAILHLKESVPDIATVFTTHATMLGRSLSSLKSDQSIQVFLRQKSAIKWAKELRIESKHSVEVIAAHEAHCFTTVSETTSEECATILGKEPDFVIQNGLTKTIPGYELLDTTLKKQMRLRLLNIAAEVTGFEYDPAETFILGTSGRYEFRNKGIDLYLDAVLDLRETLGESSIRKKILALVMCPAEHLQRVFPRCTEEILTHLLADPQHDPVSQFLRKRAQINAPRNPVHVVFIPLYLNGTDPTLPETYWELLTGMDLSVFPSWYEPWGYTPHEAVSLGIPTITTDCAGFGRWVESLPGDPSEKGVVVIQRSQKRKTVHYETHRAELRNVFLDFLELSDSEREKWKSGALKTAQKGRWDDRIEGYWQAYSFAINRSISSHLEKTFPSSYLGSSNSECAYFCMEYGINDALQIYSGGLGILAGDYIKTAADRDASFVAFGLFYQFGYFKQSLGDEGKQIALDQLTHHERIRLTRVGDQNFSIPFEDQRLYFQAWVYHLGSVRLYLLDANVLENSPQFRQITERLYSAEPGMRIKQEWLLSMGGLELIRRLGLNVKLFHMNEGHTAFIVVGRTLQAMQENDLLYEEAFRRVRNTTIFTTHTPVPVGHDQFLIEDVLSLFRGLTQDSTLLDRFLSLGKSFSDSSVEPLFNMTALAMRGSRWVNSVSQIHKKVSQKMFKNLYSETEEHEVPIVHVTNGVHISSWLESEWQVLFDEVFGYHWRKHVQDREFWKQLEKVPVSAVLETKLRLKKRLLDWIYQKLSGELSRGCGKLEYARVLARLDTHTLVMTHAKRMAPYKRADLLFQEPDRLEELLKKSPFPILFLYAGKAHPADQLGQQMIQKITQWSRDPRFMGSVLMLEDYDLSFARRLMSGSDIWLNTPLRPLEASGTSGMKAAINGTLHLSVADGWWPEVYNGKNGWMIGDGSELWAQELQNGYDSARIFHVLENDVFKNFISETWVFRIRESILSTIPFVSSERMFDDYEEKLYRPALRTTLGNG